MVLLKHKKRTMLYTEIPSFTFHYGLIKTDIFLYILLHSSHFTFHYGLIKTASDPASASASASFTFHYGLIKTV